MDPGSFLERTGLDAPKLLNKEGVRRPEGGRGILRFGLKIIILVTFGQNSKKILQWQYYFAIKLPGFSIL